MGLDTQAPYIFVPLDFYPQDKNPAPEGVRRSAPALTGLLIFAMQKNITADSTSKCNFRSWRFIIAKGHLCGICNPAEKNVIARIDETVGRINRQKLRRDKSRLY